MREMCRENACVRVEPLHPISLHFIIAGDGCEHWLAEAALLTSWLRLLLSSAGGGSGSSSAPPLAGDASVDDIPSVRTRRTSPRFIISQPRSIPWGSPLLFYSHEKRLVAMHAKLHVLRATCAVYIRTKQDFREPFYTNVTLQSTTPQRYQARFY